MTTTTYYGAYKDDDHPIAVRIWGHRLRAGQHWIEYMLEFLSVLSGFEYQLGQGLPDRGEQEGYRTEYCIPKRLGLRRFVFYDEREKTRDTRDAKAVNELRANLRQMLAEANGHGEEDLLDQVRSLLRSFSAIEEERSWYAKALFPVHEQFLLWEALRKGSTLREYALSVEHLPLESLDQGLEFRARNFFARGGELYYLILSAGTEHNPERRTRIGNRLKALLTANNEALGKMAEIIDKAWRELSGDEDGTVSGTLGWIPDPDCRLYRQIAEDLDTFLDNNLDSLECLELLAHLIGFHITTYIYHRAHPASDPEGHQSGSCLDACRPDLLIDLLGDQDGGIIRHHSASMLRQLDDWQLRQARDLVEQKVREWATKPSEDQQLIEHLEDETERFFSLGRTRSKGNYNTALREIRERYASGGVDRIRLIEGFSSAVFEALSSEFRKNFLGVHRKIGRAIGWLRRARVHMRASHSATLS
ncbi:MAG: hypothetical protein HC822_27935 [Oscillochloris sp.]|nr:hypothetical protein [Oscillochloris sp.]